VDDESDLLWACATPSETRAMRSRLSPALPRLWPLVEDWRPDLILADRADDRWMQRSSSIFLRMFFMCQRTRSAVPAREDIPHLVQELSRGEYLARMGRQERDQRELGRSDRHRRPHEHRDSSPSGRGEAVPAPESSMPSRPLCASPMLGAEPPGPWP